MKKPWFIWLSIFGFMGLFGVLGWKQFAALFHKSFDMTRWVLFLGHSMGLFFLLVVLPGPVLSMLISAIFGGSSGAFAVASCLLLAYVYFVCVFINLHLYRWARKEGLLA